MGNKSVKKKNLHLPPWSSLRVLDYLDATYNFSHTSILPSFLLGSLHQSWGHLAPHAEMLRIGHVQTGRLLLRSNGPFWWAVLQRDHVSTIYLSVFSVLMTRVIRVHRCQASHIFFQQWLWHRIKNIFAKRASAHPSISSLRLIAQGLYTQPLTGSMVPEIELVHCWDIRLFCSSSARSYFLRAFVLLKNPAS